jgi:peptide/nickel transport system permease protein
MGIPTILGVLLLLFFLFFMIASPEAMASRALGVKANPQQVAHWIKEKGYDLPKFYNSDAVGSGVLTQTRFYNYFSKMLTFDFGRSDYDGGKVMDKIKRGIGPSLMLTFPVFFGGLFVAITISMFIAIFRGTYIDRLALVTCVIGMSIVYFLYIMGAQFLLGKLLRWFPVSGWSTTKPYYFLILPIIVGIVAALAANVRFYRTVMVNEVTSDYIRTARAKGLAEGAILFRHLLKNAMIPIITSISMAIPVLFMGSVLTESFFGIPGLGYLMVSAIQNNDFPTISAMVFLSALIFVTVNLLTDITYTFFDPRISLK